MDSRVFPQRSMANDSQQSLGDGVNRPASDSASPPPKADSLRRASNKASSVSSDRSLSPISRINTPNLHPDHLHLQGRSPTLPSLTHALRYTSPSGSHTDSHLEPPPSYEALQQQAKAHKTRVAELEVINNLFRDRVQQLETAAHQTDATIAQLRDAVDEVRNDANAWRSRFLELERDRSGPRDDVRSRAWSEESRMAGKRKSDADEELAELSPRDTSKKMRTETSGHAVSSSHEG